MPGAFGRRCGRRGSRGRKKKACAEEFAAAFEEELARFVAPGTAESLDFEALETCLRRKALAEAARLLEERLNADLCDHTGPRQPCSCGHGRFPRDAALGMAGTDLSPAVQRMASTAASMVSFAEASTLLEELAGVPVGTKHVERTAEAVGRAIARDEARAPDAPAAAPAPTAYLGLDGTGIPVRKSETAGRKGKQEDGTARTREVKLVLVWTAEQQDEEGRPRRDPGSVSYSAAVESAASRDTDPQPSVFARRVRREADRRGFPSADRQVVIGDGAPWIWNLAAEQFPHAVQIVDLFHAKERLWDLAKALFPGERTRIESWAEARCGELDQGSFHALLQAVDAQAKHCEEAAQCAEYFRNNRSRMRYPEFRTQGLCVGSGVVEAGCRTVAGTRLKRSGMQWSVAGANAILALRCCRLSGRFEDFWAERFATADASLADAGADAPAPG